MPLRRNPLSEMELRLSISRAAHDRLEERNRKLEQAVAFLLSVVRSGEPYTDQVAEVAELLKETTMPNDRELPEGFSEIQALAELMSRRSSEAEARIAKLEQALEIALAGLRGYEEHPYAKRAIREVEELLHGPSKGFPQIKGCPHSATRPCWPGQEEPDA